ncbi:MAG: class I SAM-dependent methyltransferase [Oscillospiraceae bacterium]|nr:class I SAM-dependent methyltransferase [Oscillospiraceae bacterium]
MRSYQALAQVYDRLTEDVDYEAFADFLERSFRRCGRPVRTILDLACGTGSLSCVLARRGYEVIGVDASADMLAIAAEKGRYAGNIPPVFLNQPMDKLDLYGTVDACVCCLDSVNYMPVAALSKGFSRVFLFLEPGGLFLFDIRPPQVLKAMDEQVFLDEREDLICIWRASYSERRRVCTFGMDLFQKNGRDWRRNSEEHVEYAYPPEELETLLKINGFSHIRQYGNLKLRPPRPDEDRIFFAAKRSE